ncbi:zinc-ribbon domain-containing protein, partial [Endomicrobium sp. AH-315-J14]|nr:zinc-ribbon domain-containing protein [Endomicrobium sp. AH-315-J14]
MRFNCDKCGAKYQIADEKVAGKTVRMKCRKCSHTIQVKAKLGADGKVVARPSVPPPATATPAPAIPGSPKPMAPPTGGPLGPPGAPPLGSPPPAPPLGAPPPGAPPIGGAPPMAAPRA